MKWLNCCAVVVVMLACVLGLGCGGMKSESPKGAAHGDRESAGQANGEAGEGTVRGPDAGKQAVVRKIIYTASLRLIVEDFGKAEQRLAELVAAHKGYVSQSDVSGAPGSPRHGEWKIRVPQEKFEAFRKAVIGLGELERSNVDSQDVTEEYYDLKARIKNREAAEEAMRKKLDLASEKGKIEDILAVQREVDKIRLEIERDQGRLQLLTKLTEMTTVTVLLRERGAFVPPETATFGTKVERTFSGSWEALLDFGKGVVLFLVALVPWLPLIALVVVPAWLLLRRHRHPLTPAAATGPAPLAEPEQGTKGSST